jgi:NAD(P)-dependent dehydrogenase (short-subunit alcohol dehydrogenase family)
VLGPYGVNVNSIAPGVIVTDLSRARRNEQELAAYVEKSKKAAVLGRVSTTQDIANVALFLASEESSFVTGQCICADGAH